MNQINTTASEQSKSFKLWLANTPSLKYHSNNKPMIPLTQLLLCKKQFCRRSQYIKRSKPKTVTLWINTLRRVKCSLAHLHTWWPLKKLKTSSTTFPATFGFTRESFWVKKSSRIARFSATFKLWKLTETTCLRYSTWHATTKNSISLSRQKNSSCMR